MGPNFFLSFFSFLHFFNCISFTRLISEHAADAAAWARAAHEMRMAAARGAAIGRSKLPSSRAALEELVFPTLGSLGGGADWGSWHGGRNGRGGTDPPAVDCHDAARVANAIIASGVSGVREWVSYFFEMCVCVCVCVRFHFL